jgi:hypothetical protein
MGREQMRNLETSKIGAQGNEFDNKRKQGQHPDEGGTGAKKLTQAERVQQVMAEAHKKVEKRRKKEAAKAGRSDKDEPTTKSD